MFPTPPRPTLFPHDALPIYRLLNQNGIPSAPVYKIGDVVRDSQVIHRGLFKKMKSGIPQMTSPIKLFKQKRSEEHTSELQSQFHLVCRLLLEIKNGSDRMLA